MTDGNLAEFSDLDDLFMLGEANKHPGDSFQVLQEGNMIDDVVNVSNFDFFPQDSNPYPRIEDDPRMSVDFELDSANVGSKLLLTSPVGCNSDDFDEASLTLEPSDSFSLAIGSRGASSGAGVDGCAESANGEYQTTTDAMDDQSRAFESSENHIGLHKEEFTSDTPEHASTIDTRAEFVHEDGLGLDVEDDDDESRIVVSVDVNGVVDEGIGRMPTALPRTGRTVKSDDVLVKNETPRSLPLASPNLSNPNSPESVRKQIVRKSPLLSSLSRATLSAITKPSHSTSPRSASRKVGSGAIKGERSNVVADSGSTAQPLSLSEKRRLEMARFPDSALSSLEGTTSAEVRKMSPEDRALVLFKRKLRNRDSARRSRQKRQATLSDIQAEVDEVYMLTERLVDACAVKSAENTRLSKLLAEANARIHFLEASRPTMVSEAGLAQTVSCMQSQPGRLALRQGSLAVDNAKLGG